MLEELKTKLRTEADDLSDKIGKLRAFKMTTDFNRLSDKHKQLLQLQLKTMVTYRVILFNRISLLDKEE